MAKTPCEVHIFENLNLFDYEIDFKSDTKYKLELTLKTDHSEEYTLTFSGKSYQIILLNYKEALSRLYTQLTETSIFQMETEELFEYFDVEAYKSEEKKSSRDQSGFLQ